MKTPETVHQNIVAGQEAGRFLLDIVQADFNVERLAADYLAILGGARF